MKTGMIRKIDDLGRIVIPKEIRSSLRLNMGDSVEIFVEDNKILLKKHSSLLGFEEELFNISKVINEACGASILFVDEEKIIVSYGKLSEIYMDKEINPNIHLKVINNEINKMKDIYIIDNYLENRNIILMPLYVKKVIKGLFIIIENDHLLTQNDLIIINQFKKFIIKQLDR